MRVPTVQRGMVLILALVLVLVMTALGMGLLYVVNSDRDQQEALATSERLRVAAEACAERAMKNLESMGATEPPCRSLTPGALCGEVINGSMSEWSLPGDDQLQQLQDAATTYSCSTYYGSSVNAIGTVGAGFEVGQQQGYGQPLTQTKYLYRIASTATGTDGGQVQIEVIASMVY